MKENTGLLCQLNLEPLQKYLFVLIKYLYANKAASIYSSQSSCFSPLSFVKMFVRVWLNYSTKPFV